MAGVGSMKESKEGNSDRENTEEIARTSNRRASRYNLPNKMLDTWPNPIIVSPTAINSRDKLYKNRRNILHGEYATNP